MRQARLLEQIDPKWLRAADCKGECDFDADSGEWHLHNVSSGRLAHDNRIVHVRHLQDQPFEANLGQSGVRATDRADGRLEASVLERSNRALQDIRLLGLSASTAHKRGRESMRA